MSTGVADPPSERGRRARWLCARILVGSVRAGLPRLATWLAALLSPASRPARIARARDSHDRVVHVFDPFLHNAAGHYLSFDQAIRAEVESRPGWKGSFYARIDADREVRQALPTAPFFFKGARWGVRTRTHRAADQEDLGGSARPEKLLRSRRWVPFNLRRLRALDADGIRAGDVAFFATLNTQSMPATLARWLRSRGDREPIRVVIYFMLPDYAAHDGDGLSPDYSELFEALAARPPDSVILLAETPEMSADLRARSASAIPIEVAPHFKPQRILHEHAMARCIAPPSDAPRVGYAGHARRDRGAHLVPEVVHRLQARRPGSPVRVHVQDRVWRAMDLDELRRVSTLELRTGALGIEDYYAYVSGIDVMLLPFEPGPRTALQGSGVFWEALALGLVLVIPAHSHFEREARRWGAGAVCFAEWTPDDVARAAAGALENFTELAARSRAAAAKWREEKSLSVFFDRILGTAGTDTGNTATPC